MGGGVGRRWGRRSGKGGGILPPPRACVFRSGGSGKLFDPPCDLQGGSKSFPRSICCDDVFLVADMCGRGTCVAPDSMWVTVCVFTTMTTRSRLATRPCHYDSHDLPLLGPPEGIGPFPSGKGMACACVAGHAMERCAIAGSHRLPHASRPGRPGACATLILLCSAREALCATFIQSYPSRKAPCTALIHLSPSREALCATLIWFPQSREAACATIIHLHLSREALGATPIRRLPSREAPCATLIPLSPGREALQNSKAV